MADEQARTRVSEAGRATRPQAGDGVLLAGLVDSARAGDQDALTRIVRLCSPMVRAVARRYVPRAVDADDVEQEVWVTFAEHIERIESPAALRGWLVRVTTHAAWHLKRRDRQAWSLDGIAERAADDDTENVVVDGIHRAMVSADVQAALDRLPPADRRLLMLLTADDRPDYRAIARALDCRIGSIGPTRQRAMKRLRAEGSLLRLTSPSVG